MLLPEPFGPISAWTSPWLIVRLTPLRISLSSMATCRFSISNIGVSWLDRRSRRLVTSHRCSPRLTPYMAPTGVPTRAADTSSTRRCSALGRLARSWQAGQSPAKTVWWLVIVESALLLGDVPRDQRHRHIDIDQHAAAGAMDVIVALDAVVVAAGLVGEGQLLDQAVLGEQMQRAIDGAVGDRGSRRRTRSKISPAVRCPRPRPPPGSRALRCIR